MKLILLFSLLIASTFAYHEKFRPGYHFSPPKNWMNDPNGLIFYGGLYQMYYQYNPYDVVWGHMSWGHAVSLDLVTWKNLPVAIPEYDGVMIYSGCNILDVNNTSGFCKGKECLLAFYTAQTDKGEAQAFAYSNDFGLTYTQYAKNPIINENLADHRDPKVIWYEPGQKWVMVTALSTQFKLRLYSSTNLVDWAFLSDFGPEGSVDGGWEDPDLFSLIDDEGNEKWILSHATNVAKVQYYIGEFDGTTFTTTESKGVDLYFDYGRDFTEAATFNNEPRGRRIIVAYLSEAYALGFPTGDEGWRGSLTLFRELKLRRYPEGLRIVSEPIEAYSKLRGESRSYESVELTHGKFYEVETLSNQLELIANFTLPNDASQLPSEFGFKVFVGGNQSTTIGYDAQRQVLFTNRTISGIVDIDDSFPCTTNVTLAPENGVIQLRIFLDHNSVEVFANNGKVAMTNAIFPDQTENKIYVYARDGEATLDSLVTYALKDIWPKETDEENSKEFLSVTE